MGYITAMSACIGCRRLFSYNPHSVPSVTVNGSREPICRECVEKYNPIRKAKGLEPIVPLAGAYEPIEEGEL